MPAHMAGLREWLYSHGHPMFGVIEAQQAMPGQGVTSMFSVGQRYGLLTGLLIGLQIPFEAVRPQAWMRALGIPPKADKRAHVERALSLFPTAEVTGPRGGMKDGRADALLIAEYGRRTHGGMA
jgi:crossover junction endodeoxyribonuclease RuvC